MEETLVTDTSVEQVLDDSWQSGHGFAGERKWESTCLIN
jgi:hypothetical protein